MNYSILVLGSEGFIGTHCVNYFLQTGKKVIGADLMISPKLRSYEYVSTAAGFEVIRDLLCRENIDILINAAGSGSVPFSLAHPAEDFKANCTDTFSLLELIRGHSPQTRYLHISSAAVYGNPERIPVQETDAIAPLSPYGYHKAIAEKLCVEFNHVYNLRVAVVRPFSVYGPGLRKQLFWDLYAKLSNAGEQPSLFGTGRESRDFVYVEDLVRAMALILEKGAMRGEIYNIGSGMETTINEAVALYVNALGLNTSFTFNGIVREGDPLNWKACIKRLEDLGYKPEISLAEGLTRLAAWIKTIG